MPTKDSGSNEDHDVQLTEWGKVRDLFQNYDNNLHDLRKFGFSFVTALLTADGLLLSSSLSTSTPAAVKFAVYGVTLLLIMAIHLIDQNYQSVEEATATRGLVLERNLNIELSDTIADRYHREHINRYVFIVYAILDFCVVLLGWISLGRQFMYIGLLFIVLIVTFLITSHNQLQIVFTSRMKKKENKYYQTKADWTISPLTCAKKGVVKIILNNLGNLEAGQHVIERIKNREDIMQGINLISKKEKMREEDLIKQIAQGLKIPKPVSFKKGEIIWELIHEETGESVVERAKEDMNIYTSYSWIVNRNRFKKPGVYQLQLPDKLIPLYRSIIVGE